MIDVPEYIYDISYSVNENVITIQLILKNGHFISEYPKQNLISSLPKREIKFKEIQMTEIEFKASSDSWSPMNYDWLENVLYSKSIEQ